MEIGIISDTHGLLRPEAVRALSGASLIFHAGDVGGLAILEQLRTIAPVHAVYGNVDPPDAGLAAAIDCQIERVTVHVSHGHELGSPRPETLLARYPAADVIVFGHTHQALIERHGRRLVINPGAAGPRRFKLRPSIARLTIRADQCEAQLIWLM